MTAAAWKVPGVSVQPKEWAANPYKRTVKYNGVNIRKGPSTSYASKGQLQKGNVVTIYGYNNGYIQAWQCVYSAKHKFYGWIKKSAAF